MSFEFPEDHWHASTADFEVLGNGRVRKIFKNSFWSRVSFYRAKREATICRSLSFRGFPFVPKYFDFGSAGSRYYIEMELIEGPNLETLNKNRRELNWLLVFGLVAEDLSSLAEAGYVHRDVKLYNLLVKGLESPHEDLRPILVDFGLTANVRRGNGAKIAGSPVYMSPEQVRGIVDPRSDIYSLGMNMYQVFAGEHPFENARSKNQALEWQKRKMPPPLCEVAQVESGVSDVVMKCIQKDPNSRYQTGSEVANDLSRFI